jgi:predicted nucleic acid-binding protein
MPIQKILLDSDILVSLNKTDDPNHAKAKRIQEKYSHVPHIFYLSNLVFSESITVISQKVNHQTAVNFIKQFQSRKPHLNYIYIDQNLEKLAINIFKKQTSKNISFVDCTNIAIYQKYNLDAIFSFDKHYKKNGVTTL